MVVDRVRANHLIDGSMQFAAGRFGVHADTLARITALEAAPSSGGGPWLSPPATPNAFDDEFLGGSADLAARGWRVYNITAAVDMTRAGVVIPGDDGSGLTSSTYRSTISDFGGILLQFSNAASNVFVSKAVSLTQDAALYAGMSVIGRLDAGANGQTVRVMLSQSATSEAEALFTQKRRTSTTQVLDAGGYVASVFVPANAGSGSGPPTGLAPNVLGISTSRVGGTTTKWFTVLDGVCGEGWGMDGTMGGHIEDYGFAGFFFESAAVARGLNMYHVRFVRAKSEQSGIPFLMS